MNDKTSTLLVEDLERLKAIEKDRARRQAIKRVIARAKARDFDDFHSAALFPKLELVSALAALNLPDLSQAAAEGRYD